MINEKSVEVELDTGSPISIMNEELLQQISDDNTEINNDPGPRCFTDFNNKVVRIEKTAKLKTQFKRTRRHVKWWIVKHECKPIIGTDYMEKLGMFVGYKPPERLTAGIQRKPETTELDRISKLVELTS